jgi:hypothetical protein
MGSLSRSPIGILAMSELKRPKLKPLCSINQLKEPGQSVFWKRWATALPAHSRLRDCGHIASQWQALAVIGNTWPKDFASDAGSPAGYVAADCGVCGGLLIPLMLWSRLCPAAGQQSRPGGHPGRKSANRHFLRRRKAATAAMPRRIAPAAKVEGSGTDPGGGA